MVRIGVRVSVGRGSGFLAGKERNDGGATAVGGPSYSVVFGAVGAHLRVILEWRRCYYFGSFTVERERETTGHHSYCFLSSKCAWFY